MLLRLVSWIGPPTPRRSSEGSSIRREPLSSSSPKPAGCSSDRTIDGLISWLEASLGRLCFCSLAPVRLMLRNGVWVGLAPRRGGGGRDGADKEPEPIGRPLEGFDGRVPGRREKALAPVLCPRLALGPAGSSLRSLSSLTGT